MVTTTNYPKAVGFELNTAPAGFDAKRDFAPGLYESVTVPVVDDAAIFFRTRPNSLPSSFMKSWTS
jgi:hypothetical protein